MSSHLFKVLTLGATFALGAGGTWAQTTAPSDKPVTTIGVSPQDAKEATQKAAPADDTATLVRTDESAADQAKEASKKVKRAITPDAKDKAKKSPSASKSTQPKASDKSTETPATSTPSNAIVGTTLLEEEAKPPMTGRPAPETNKKLTSPGNADQK